MNFRFFASPVCCPLPMMPRFLFAFLFGLIATAAQAQRPTLLPRVVDIGPERQLFIDEYLIDRMDGVHRVVNSPVKEKSNPIFRAEKPWEWKRITWLDVLFDGEENIFKLWYSTFNPETALTTQLKTHLDYATSTDGINFTRPSLGLVEFNGSTDNNLAPMPAGGMSLDKGIFKDTHDPDPLRRYKMVYIKPGTHGWSVAWSPDGLHWTPHEFNPVISPAGDAAPKAFWDPRQQRYVLYARPDGHHVHRWSSSYTAKDFPTRRIGRAESLDFKLWTDLEEVMAPDKRDGDGVEFYCMATMPYEGCYIGMLTVYNEFSSPKTADPSPDPRSPAGAESEASLYPPHVRGMNSTLYSQLAASRDGRNWTRVGDRQVFLAGDPEAWDEKRVYPESALVRGDEIWIYYRGSNTPHRKIGELIGRTIDGKTFVGDALGLAKLRLDGFVSIETSRRVGTLTTWPLSAKAANGLRLNADADAGSICVEVLNRDGVPFPGLTRRECRPVTVDSVRAGVSWISGKSLADVREPFRLRFVMRQARLFSFQVTN